MFNSKLFCSTYAFNLELCFTVTNDQVKEDEMGSACSTNGGEEECI
jgi:hypothetical protein